MKFVRFRDGGEARYGVLEGDAIYAATGDPFSGLTKTGLVGNLDDLSLLPPIQPGKIVCVGLNYVAHVTENDPTRTIPEEPVLFMKPPSALIAHGEAIKIANPENRTDHEAELVVVIGKTARNVAVEDVPGFVLGYTCGNDVSDRVLQRKDGQWIRAKGFDTYCPLGPCIETEVGSLRRQGRIPAQWHGPPVADDRGHDLERAHAGELHQRRDDARTR